jgi:hypothetical protein
MHLKKAAHHKKKEIEKMSKHHGMKSVHSHPHMQHEEVDHGSSVAHEKKKAPHKKTAHKAKKHHKK